MFHRNALLMLLFLGLALTTFAPAHAGVIKAVKAKHKANPDSLHAKVQANIKDHKAYSGHQPLRPSKRK